MLRDQLREMAPESLDGTELTVALALAMGCQAEYHNPFFAYCRCGSQRHAVFNEVTGGLELPHYARSLDALQRCEEPFLKSGWRLDVAVTQKGDVRACWHDNHGVHVAGESGATEALARARALLVAYRSMNGAIYQDGKWLREVQS